VDFNELGLQLMTLSAHKIYGPKGIGALIVDKSIDIQPLIFGGRHEKGLRAGTENVAAIVGFGVAAEIATAELTERSNMLTQLRNYLEQCLSERTPGAVVFSQSAPRLPNTSFFAVPGIDGETLLMNLDLAGVAVSAGSACESASATPSHVLSAMGIDERLARGAIRVSLGIDNTLRQISQFIEVFQQSVNRLKTMTTVAAV
jgi:cysteine desulfurase